MLTMDKIHDIRIRFFVKGENISQIANELKLDCWILTNQPLINGLKRTNKHRANSGIPPRGYLTGLRKNSSILIVPTGRLLRTTPLNTVNYSAMHAVDFCR
jgi:hypothetical protein